MATYLFAWNPSLWNWPEMPADRRKLARRGYLDTDWNSGRVRNIDIGSRAFLVRVGVPPKGIFGAGYTLTAPHPEPHWRPERAAAGAVMQRLTLRLDTLLELPAVTYDDLEQPPFARFRWGVRSSGVHMPSALADALEELWEARSIANRARAARPSRPRKIRADPAD